MLAMRRFSALDLRDIVDCDAPLVLLNNPFMTHHFSIDPRSVLGVGDDASMEEIHNAFRNRSKKHHPDHGGDEWAFRMVVRAYEILKTTKEIEERHPCTATVANDLGSGSGTTWGNDKADRVRPMSADNENLHPFTTCDNTMASGPKDEPAFAHQSRATAFSPTAAEFRTIDVELVWIRFELAGDLKERVHEEPDATTLSVCMVLSWPRASLVKHAAKFPDAAEKLRVVIEAFEHLRCQEKVLGSRSRIEDGQFVGWLSYPNVLEAEAGFQVLQETVSAHDLRVSLRTRDELLPAEWINR
jgi:DnaJ domain